MSGSAEEPGAVTGAVTSGQVVLVVGESLVDVVRRPGGAEEERAGGSAANVAVALARQDRAAWFVTALADDRHGGIVAAHLGRDGVRLAADPETIDHTSRAVAAVGADGVAGYVFDIDWRLRPDTTDQVRGTLADAVAATGTPAEPGWVHTCSIAAVLLPGAGTVAELLAAFADTALISYDINARPGVTGLGADVVARTEAVVAAADLVKASDEDLEALWPALSEAERVAHLLDLGAAVVVVTRGADGLDWHTASTHVHVPAVPDVAVVDTIGAGDTVAASLLVALSERGIAGASTRAAIATLGEPQVADVLAYAARAAARTVARPGADPPYRAELVTPGD